MNDFYKRIKQKREELGLSQDELAQRLGYKSRSTIAKIESGDNDIPRSKIDAFAEALNTTPQYLMGWIKNTNTDEETIDYYDDALGEIVGILEANGYQIEDGLLDLMHIYDKDKNLVGGIKGHVLVENYEQLKYRQSQITTEELLQPLLSEYSLIYKYRAVDEKGKHTIETIADMEYNRCKKDNSVT